MESTLSAALIVAIVVSLIKPFVEVGIKPNTPLHDGLIRLLAVVIGVVGEIANHLVTAPLTGPIAWSAAQDGLVAGIAAIASYHVVTTNVFGSTLGTSGITPTSSPPQQTTTGAGVR